MMRKTLRVQSRGHLRFTLHRPHLHNVGMRQCRADGSLHDEHLLTLLLAAHVRREHHNLDRHLQGRGWQVAKRLGQEMKWRLPSISFPLHSIHTSVPLQVPRYTFPNEPCPSISIRQMSMVSEPVPETAEEFFVKLICCRIFSMRSA